MFGFTPRGGLPPDANYGLISGLNLFKSRLRPAAAGVQIRVAAFGQQPVGPFDRSVVGIRGDAEYFEGISGAFQALFPRVSLGRGLPAPGAATARPVSNLENRHACFSHVCPLFSTQ
jgi:hypothetical protein